jgi:hypothetical protein
MDIDRRNRLPDGTTTLSGRSSLILVDFLNPQTGND